MDIQNDKFSKNISFFYVLEKVTRVRILFGVRSKSDELGDAFALVIFLVLIMGL